MLDKKLRGHPVGRDHEVFNQFLGPVFLLHTQVHDPPVVEHRFGLDGLKLQRAVLVANRFHGVGDLVLHPELLVQTFDPGNLGGHLVFAIQPVGYASVGKLRVVVNQGSVHSGFLDSPVRCHHHLDHQGKPVFALGKGSKVRREPFRQHGEDGGTGVHGGCVCLGVPVDC